MSTTKAKSKSNGPPIPPRLWMLWNKPNGREAGFWIVAIDGACDVLMAFDNARDASHEAARQNDIYELNCVAVRVK